MTTEHGPLEHSRLLEGDTSTNSSESLLPTTSNEASAAADDPAPGARSVLIRLYVSHSLSAWNSRMFEFGAVLFLASIFPGTLLYASIYALVRAFSAVALASWLGAKVDNSDRLVALRHSIGMLLVLFLHGRGLTVSSLAKSPCCGVLFVFCGSFDFYRVRRSYYRPFRSGRIIGLHGEAGSHG